MTNLNVRLSCRHTTTQPHTSISDTAYCRYHGYQDITYIWASEWRVACLKCQYGAWCKDSQTGANRRGAKHQQDRGDDHICVVLYDDKIKPTSREQLRKDHQKGLHPDKAEYKVDLFGYSTEPDAPPPF